MITNHAFPFLGKSTWCGNTVSSGHRSHTGDTPTLAWDKLLNPSESLFPRPGNEGKLESRTPNAQSSHLSGLLGLFLL